MEAATTIAIPTPAVDEKILAQRTEAWGKFGADLYKSELTLQARAQASLLKLKAPKTIQEVAESEKVLAEVRKELNTLIADRKAITSKFDEVSARLMGPEKSFDLPLKETAAEIIKVKKADEEKRAADLKKIEQLQKCREELTRLRNDNLAKFKNLINEKIAKAYEYALGDGGIELEDVPQFLDLAYTRLTDADLKIPYPIKSIQYDTVDTDTYVKLCNELLIVDTKPLLAEYQEGLKLKFSDYAVALENKSIAIEKAKQETKQKAADVETEKVNSNVSATMETLAVVHNPVVSSGVKALKKIYEVDMHETLESSMAIWAAFTANMELCLPKLSVKKWFSLTPAQLGTALAKAKTDNNDFSPFGITFKEVDKL